MLSRIKVALASSNPAQRLFDFLFAAILYSLPASYREKRYRGSEHFCPICNSQLRTFLALHRKHHLFCPVCGSLQRFRFVWLLLNKLELLTGEPIKILDIAPGRGISDKLQELFEPGYVSIDLYNKAAMYRMDITDIRFPDNSFNMVYCSHVLEHVDDDRKALAEMFRVLAPGGHAVILVPILADVTFEDASITDPLEKEKVFGQLDHVRNYGQDFDQRVMDAGFQVKTFIAREHFSQEEIHQMGLPAEETIFLGYK